MIFRCNAGKFVTPDGLRATPATPLPKLDPQTHKPTDPQTHPNARGTPSAEPSRIDDEDEDDEKEDDPGVETKAGT